MVEGTLYHPGDALDVPEEDVETLLVPIQGAWIKTSEALDFVHAVAPRLSVGIHDAHVNERGLGALNRWMEREASTAYRWMQPGRPPRSSPATTDIRTCCVRSSCR